MSRNYYWVFVLPVLMIFSECKNASAGKTSGGNRPAVVNNNNNIGNKKETAPAVQQPANALPINISSTSETVKDAKADGKLLYSTNAEQQKHAAARKSNTTRKKVILTRGNFPEASERKLTDWDVVHLSNWGYTVMLNEIYARHGMIFHEPAVAAYFKKVRWYRGKYKNVDRKLTPIERENIKYLKSPEVTSMPRS